MLEHLDPGILETVRLLRAAGFETTDSGDGVSKPEEHEGVIRFPHVVAVLSLNVEDPIAECHRMAELLGGEWEVTLSYGSRDRTLILFAERNHDLPS